MPVQPVPSARPAETAEQLQRLRREVQRFLQEWSDHGRFEPSCDAWLRSYDLDFTKALAEHGWIGITWPTELGGSGRSNAARLVVTEELLRVGAPVAAHWIADRQIGPAILRYGSSHLQHMYLPRIAAGEVTFCLGMSETESGSDLASVRTTATPVEGGWLIRGTKVWTSQAHRSSHAYLLARTDRSERKHEGLTEFIVDMSATGVDVRPIYDLSGEHHFNEMTFDDVFVPADHVLGQPGRGWQQVTEQLSFERGGMERVLSTYPLLAHALQTLREQPIDVATSARIGTALAQLASLRALGWDVTVAMDTGHAPVQQAAVLKDLGTSFEREVTNLVRELTWCEPDPTATGLPGLLAGGILSAPGFTIRGGTTEVLRTVIARGAATERPRRTGDLDAVADDVLAEQGGDPPTDRQAPGPVWQTVCGLGWPHVGIDEAAGGQGGTLSDLASLLIATGRHAVPVPLAETAAAAQLLAAGDADLGAVGEVLTVALPSQPHPSRADSADLLRLDRAGEQPTVTGTVTRVPWASCATRIVGYAQDGDGVDGASVAFTLAAGAPGLQLQPGANVAGEPRDHLLLNATPVELLPAAPTLARAQNLVGLLRAAGIVGALQRAYTHTLEHVQIREQFGRPLVRFQAVGHSLATLYSHLALADAALRRAIDTLGGDEAGPESQATFDGTARVRTARIVAGAAATEAARLAHQLHGAMGVTREHPLHLATRRLWAWRDEWQGQHPAAAALGVQLGELPEDQMWDWLTAQAGTRGY